MPSPLSAPGLAGLWVADDLAAAVNGELIGAWPSTAPAYATSPSWATDADKPQMLVAGIGGRRSLTFDGVSDRLQLQPTPFAVGWPGITGYGVVRSSVLATNKTIFGLTTETTATNQFFLSINNANQARCFTRRVAADAATSAISTGLNLADGQPHVLCGVADYTAGTVAVYVDGTLAAQGTLASTGTTSGSVSARLMIGTEGGSYVAFFSGQLAMTGMYQQAHDAAARAEVHSWAQDTYGIPVSDHVASGPATPTGLVRTFVSSTRQDIAWDAVPGAVAYEVERNGVIISRVLTTSFSDTGLSPATQYTYRVRAEQ